jgi:hypothetical protein
MHNDESVWKNKDVPFAQNVSTIPPAARLVIRKAYYGFEEVQD